MAAIAGFLAVALVILFFLGIRTAAVFYIGNFALEAFHQSFRLDWTQALGVALVLGLFGGGGSSGSKS